MAVFRSPVDIVNGQRRPTQLYPNQLPLPVHFRSRAVRTTYAPRAARPSEWARGVVLVGVRGEEVVDGADARVSEPELAEGADVHVGRRAVQRVVPRPVGRWGGMMGVVRDPRGRAEGEVGSRVFACGWGGGRGRGEVGPFVRLGESEWGWWWWLWASRGIWRGMGVWMLFPTLGVRRGGRRRRVGGHDGRGARERVSLGICDGRVNDLLLAS
jgi:hypothetical protein